jgi:ribonuclease-3
VIEDQKSLERRLGYTFEDKSLLTLALTHRSYQKENNERLEYLGDAILGFIIAEALYNRFEGEAEGVLTRLRANLVKGETLAILARELEIGDHILLGPGEMKSGGWRRDSILSNTLEALIGAIYLDSDILSCKIFVLSIYTELLLELNPSNLSKDPKTKLQEYLQAKKVNLPVYTVVAEDGEAHKREFTVECSIENLDHEIMAVGRSKRNAEQLAAEKALDYIVEKDK